MKFRTPILILTILIATSCESKVDKVDREVNDQIKITFASEDKQLWTKVEDEFYERCRALGLLENEKDRLHAFYKLMEFVQNAGYPEEFYVKKDAKSRQLIEDLKQIGYLASDESAQRFLHRICKPIVDKYQYESEDVIYGFAKYDPDSVSVSFDLTAASMPVGLKRPKLKREGLYRALLLFYFSRMISER